VGGGPVLDVGGRPEGDLHRRGGVAAGAGRALPGVSTLARLVAQVRDDTTRRLWGVLEEGLLTVGQRYLLDRKYLVNPSDRGLGRPIRDPGNLRWAW